MEARQRPRRRGRSWWGIGAKPPTRADCILRAARAREERSCARARRAPRSAPMSTSGHEWSPVAAEGAATGAAHALDAGEPGATSVGAFSQHGGLERGAKYAVGCSQMARGSPRRTNTRAPPRARRRGALAAPRALSLPPCPGLARAPSAAASLEPAVVAPRRRAPPPQPPPVDADSAPEPARRDADAIAAPPPRALRNARRRRRGSSAPRMRSKPPTTKPVRDVRRGGARRRARSDERVLARRAS